MENNQTVVLYKLSKMLEATVRSILARNGSFTCLDGEEWQDQETELVVKDVPTVIFTEATSLDQEAFDLFTKYRQVQGQLIVFVFSNDKKLIYENSKYSTEFMHWLSLPLSLKQVKHALSDLNAEKLPAYLDLFHEMIYHNNYREAYQSVEQLARLICDNQKVIEIKKAIREILVNGYSLAGLYTADQKKDFYQKINTRWPYSYRDRSAVELYLFAILDLIFQKRVITQRNNLSPAFTFIDDHLYQEMTLNQIAEACNLSESYLCKLSDETLKIGFNQYIQIKKMQLAKEEFYFNNARVIDVAVKLDFNEPGYFSKVFKRVTQQTPSRYKKVILKNKANGMI